MDHLIFNEIHTGMWDRRDIMMRTESPTEPMVAIEGVTQAAGEGDNTTSTTIIKIEMPVVGVELAIGATIEDEVAEEATRVWTTSRLTPATPTRGVRINPIMTTVLPRTSPLALTDTIRPFRRLVVASDLTTTLAVHRGMGTGAYLMGNRRVRIIQSGFGMFMGLKLGVAAAAG